MFHKQGPNQTGWDNPPQSQKQSAPNLQPKSLLAPLKDTNKFSSWADKSVFDSVDELISDSDQQTPNSCSSHSLTDIKSHKSLPAQGSFN
jgi:hypothetical protein